MSKNKVNSSRRNVVLGVGAGVASASVWQTPAVKSVLLPAHATMSEEVVEVEMEVVNFEAGGTSGGVTPTSTGGDVAQNKGFLERTLDSVVPEAHAGTEISSCSEEITEIYLEELLPDRTKIMAEAINNEDGTYDLTIVALVTGQLPIIKKPVDVDECISSVTESLVVEEEYIPRYKWEGTLSDDGSEGTLTDVSGCDLTGQDESGAILAVDMDAMTMKIEMSYNFFEIEFDLEEGPITLPSIECYDPYTDFK